MSFVTARSTEWSKVKNCHCYSVFNSIIINKFQFHEMFLFQQRTATEHKIIFLYNVHVNDAYLNFSKMEIFLSKPILRYASVFKYPFCNAR